jgi:hypothetical protein
MAHLRHKDLIWDTPFSKHKRYPSESESLVFKVEDIKPDSPHLIGKGVFCPTVTGECPELGEPWVDLTLDEARAWCLAGKSCYFCGIPGTGKSWETREIFKQLAGRKELLGPTHVSCQNLR